MAVLADEGEVSRAFRVVEEARARTLYESVRRAVLVAADELPRVDDTRLRAELPGNIAVIEYEVLNDRLLAFVCRVTGTRLETVRVTRERLERLCQKARSGGTTPQCRLSPGSRAISIATGPSSSDARYCSSLVFVLAKSVHEVLFATLRNISSNRYLVEEYEVGLSPSVGIYLDCVRRDRELAHDSLGHALVVGNPRFNESLLPGLRRLDQADREAHDVAQVYQHTTLLAGSGATKSLFLSRGAQASLIHFAGHAVLEPNMIMSSLVSQTSTHVRGLLYAHEINLWALRRGWSSFRQ